MADQYPSRFSDELPEANVEVTEAQGGYGGFGGYGGYGASRFDATTAFGSNYATPGWRARTRKRASGVPDGGRATGRTKIYLTSPSGQRSDRANGSQARSGRPDDRLRSAG